MGKYLPNKLKTVYCHQKHALQIVFSQEKLTHSRPLLRSFNALNVYQTNLYQRLNFMHKVSNNVAPLIFNDMFKKPSYKYPTNFSQKQLQFKEMLFEQYQTLYFLQRT